MGVSCLDIMLKNKKITFGNTYRLDSALLKIISYIQKCMDLLKANTRHPHFTNYLIAYKQMAEGPWLSK